MALLMANIAYDAFSERTEQMRAKDDIFLPNPTSFNAESPLPNLSSERAADCTQIRRTSTLTGPQHGLFLNVIGPANASADAKLPVLSFWDYGDSFTDSSNAMLAYNGTAIVQRSIELSKPVIYVALNYRANDEEFISYVTRFLLPSASPVDLQTPLQLYPSDPAAGSPFDTGDANASSPQYMRLAAAFGDRFFFGPRRLFLEKVSFKRTAYIFR
ncbi:hypothetical protein C8T65DRAFT_746108 [Cerioporus squamosus]|nr:hypothetical protein C8T65DRAFT_746108 [Cerioporus squamosus]